MLKWSDEQLAGQGYVDRYPFEHPQLGIGGAWRLERLARLSQPAARFLGKGTGAFPDWLLWHLAISPKLELYEVSVTPAGDGAQRVRFVAHNTGWLPTYITKKALQRKAVRGVVVEISLPAGATLITGELREELGQLEGRASMGSAPMEERRMSPTTA